MVRAEVSAAILEYLNANRRDQATQIYIDTPLIASGAIDSLQILDLIEFTEHRFGLSLGEDDLSPLHFESVANIANLIVKKRDGQ